jgi:hypothetical protein
MSTSAKIEIPIEAIKKVITTTSKLQVVLTDGREISVPLEWYPRLHKATQAQRQNYRLIGEGTGIHWPEIDEDLDLEGILGGYPSPEYKKRRANR